MVGELSVESHRSEEELILYLSRELDVSYEEARERYEQAEVVATF